MPKSKANGAAVSSHDSRTEAKRLKFAGIHNCCGLCSEAIKGAVESVPGVTADTVQPGKSDFEVVGNFRPDAVVEALHAAGFHARMEE